MSKSDYSKASPVRLVYVMAGLFFTAIGAIGMVLPVLPGIPFLVVALFCFQRSSRQLEGWLLENRFVGRQLREWRQGRKMSRRTKMISLAMMVTALPAIWLAPIDTTPKIISTTLLFVSATFILARPEPNSPE